jgi:N-acetylmuramoyl-L-alanine amidase
MIFAVRHSFLFIAFLIATATALIAQQIPTESGARTEQAQRSLASDQVGATSPESQQISPPPAAAPQPAYTGPVIVLNPAHGGTDTGARGDNGITEKDVVLQFARALRVELVRQGYRVVMTRDDDSNPSYQDRAAMANSYRNAIFISLHVSSTGMIGTARAYYYHFANPLAPAAPSGATASAASIPPAASLPPGPGLAPWDQAQKTYETASHRLADMIQSQLAQLFTGSPDVSQGVAVRGLRSVAAPAVAIEISSVAVPNVDSLTAMAAPLATSVVKGLGTFRATGPAGAR